MVESTLRRISTVTDPAEFEKRRQALISRLLPHLQRQSGFVSHELRLDGAQAGGQAEITVWRTAEDCRSYLRNGAAAMAATWLDAFFPTAAFPDGTWTRETIERA